MKVTKIKPAYVSGGGGEPDPPPPAEERMEVPAGGIIMYTGEIAPAGFTKENGLRFVMISGSTATNKTATAGSLVHHTHTLPASSVEPAHAHSASASAGTSPASVTYYSWNVSGAGSPTNHSHSGGSVSFSPSGEHSHPAGSLAAFLGDVHPPHRYLNFIKNTSGGLTVAPVGSIVMFDGVVSSVPDGWAICDGTNGTVDMRERFGYGATNNTYLLESGGSKTHTHPAAETASAGEHNHNYSTRLSDASGEDGFLSGHPTVSVARSGHYHTASSAVSTQAAHSHTYPAVSGDHMPPYVYLYYIQRIT